MLNWPDKDKDATLDYRWQPPLDAGDTLVSGSITVVSGDVSIIDQASDESGVTIFLSGGTRGAVLFRGIWASAAGRSDDEYIALQIVDDTPTIPELRQAYGTDYGFTAWLAANGYAIPSGSPSLAVLRARGSNYVDGYEAFWTGTRTGGFTQDLAWPRTGATLNCTLPIPDDLIPPTVISAAYRAAYLEAVTSGTLNPASAKPGQRVKRQKVDVVEREFFDDGSVQSGKGPAFIDSAIDTALRQFVCDATGGAFMWSLGC